MTRKIKVGDIVIVNDTARGSHSITVPKTKWKVFDIDTLLIGLGYPNSDSADYRIPLKHVDYFGVDVDYFNKCLEYIKDNNKQVRFVKGRAVAK